VNISIPIEKIDLKDFEAFLLSKYSFGDFISSAVLIENIYVDSVITVDQFADSMKSWNKYVNQLGYEEERKLLRVC
jgi:hypothetical protein